MSAVLKLASGIAVYSAEYATQVLALARAMHAESVMAAIPLAEDKLREGFAMSAVNPNIYLRLWLHEGEVIGGLYGMIVPLYWSHENVAADRAWFMLPGRRGGVAAVRLLRDFEVWAKSLGIRWVMPGQTTGVRMDETRQLFEGCGYQVRGCNFMKEI